MSWNWEEFKMEFTEEQQAHIDSLIEKATEEATDGLYTEDELNKKITAEVDRRVESGIQKGLETKKAKWEQEFERKAQMSAEELAKLTVDEQMEKIAEREAEINTRSNRIDAREMFAEANIPEDDYSKFMDLLVTDDVDTTHSNVSNFIESFNTTRDNIEKSVKNELSKIPSPKGDEEGSKEKSQVSGFVEIANQANIRKI